MEPVVELLAGELPADRSGLTAVLGLEGEDASLQLRQAVGDRRRQHLALEDAEEDLDLIEPGGVDRRVDQDQVGVALAEAAGRLGALVRAAVVHDPEDARRRAVGLHGHNLVDQPGEGVDAGLGLAAAPGDAAANIPGAQVLESAAAFVVALDATRLARPGCHLPATSCLYGGLLVGRDDLVAS